MLTIFSVIAVYWHRSAEALEARERAGFEAADGGFGCPAAGDGWE